MRKRMPRGESTALPRKREKGTGPADAGTRWASRILLYLEGKDPRLLDKETYKVYRKISGTGARLQGPVPLPVKPLSDSSSTPGTDRLHRRLFLVWFPTEMTVSLLEKLALSEAVQTSISVEEIPVGGDL
jgi:ribosomal protein S10